MADGSPAATTAKPAAENVDPRDGALPLLVVDHAASPRRAPHRFLRYAGVVPIVMVLLLTGAVVGLYFQPPGPRIVMGWLGLEPGGGSARPFAVPAAPAATRPETASAPAPARVVLGLGKLLPAGEVIVIAPPFGAGDARVSELRVAEGERVARGAILAVLDSERLFLAALESARAGVAAREAVLAQVRGGVESSRAEARAALARAMSAADTAAREYDRAEELRRRGAATEQLLDQRRAAREETSREVERLRATLGRYGDGPIDAQADVVVASRNLDSARADFERAQADLEKAYVRAPTDATVIAVEARPGEKPGTRGILKLGDIERMMIEVEVYQAQIARVAVGAAVEARAEALARPLNGVVTRIGLEVGRQTLVDANPAANTDARVVKVTVALDPASAELARGLTNLQVTARIASSGGGS
jgi:HlyD family secretion protein